MRWHGEEFFQNLIKKAHDEIAGPQEAEPEQGPAVGNGDLAADLPDCGGLT